MIKLKTLKDMKSVIIEEVTYLDAIYIEDLKQEAIKWVKHYQLFYDTSMKTNNFNGYPNAGESMCTIEFIKKFFNITEEDLR